MSLITQTIGVAIFTLLAMIPLLYKMYVQGTINVDKPEKRTYLFEDEEGEQYNPFEGPEEEEQNEWKYSPNNFN